MCFLYQKGRTPLMWASIKGHVNVIEWLHGKRADLKTKDNNGMNAFMLAIKGGQMNSLQWLQDNGVVFKDNDMVNNVLLLGFVLLLWPKLFHLLTFASHSLVSLSIFLCVILQVLPCMGLNALMCVTMCWLFEACILRLFFVF
eukprot:GHVR01147014.1.p1 GENE.GHVR01147014.1~~GHVR01147014.1.p1  ORF type:complete len:143 (-),score=6.89 GHVR01147014.1:508-936(-)